MMFNNNRVRRALKLALMTGAATAFAFSAPIYAQDQAADEATEDDFLEEVIVTGSRIARDGFATPAPVTVLDSMEIEAVGATNIGEFLARVPQTVSTINSSNAVFSNNSSGLQTQALRNLGAQRTLVLVNGRRFVSGQSPGDGYAVDLNAIPVALVERIEIKTGGTSAIYGSDAIAGVINFILKDDFEGLEINYQYGITAESDRKRNNIDFTMGSNFEGGNAWAAFGYSDDEGLTAQDREFSNTDLAWYDQAYLDAVGLDKPADHYWLGSSFPPWGRFGNYIGTGEPFRSGLADQENSDRFNRALYRDIASPVTRHYAAAGITYAINDKTEAHILINYNQTNIDTTFEPFPLDLVSDVWDIPKGGTGGLDIATSPLLPELLRTNLLNDGYTNLNQLASNTTARRLVEFEGRGSMIDRRTFRVAAGVNWTLDNNMDVILHGTWGQTKADQQVNSGINAERAVYALDAIVDDTGNVICRNEEARRFGCAPFDVFGAGTISPEAVEYLALNTQTDQLVQQAVAGIELVGETYFIPDLPGGTIGFAAGLEYREEKGSEIPDASVQSGVTTSNKIAATGGSWNVVEGFLEMSFPIIDQLTIDAAYRYGDYSTVGGQSNWMVGFDAPVTEWVRFRGTYSNAVRAPNVSDLFSGAGETFATFNDPCNGVTAETTGTVAENCRSIPAIAQRIEQFGVFALTQVERQSTGGFNSGNPDAQEETADTWTLGFVLTPTSGFMSNFQFSFDYYSIELYDVLGLESRFDTVNNCMSVSPSEFDPLCPGPVQNGARTVRNPDSGVLIEVNRSLEAVEDWTTSGFDVELNYGQEFGPGLFTANLLWTHIEEFDVVSKATGNVNEVGGEITTPDDRVYFGMNYTMDKWFFNYTISWMSSAVDSVEYEDFSENGSIFEPFTADANTCSSVSYHSISANWSFAEDWQLYGGVRNLWDEDPCPLTQFHQYGDTGLNTNSIYDINLRNYFIGLRARF